MYADITYSLLLLTQALHAAASPEWRVARGQALASIEEWKSKAGTETVTNHLALPVIKRRYTAVQALQ